MRALYTLGTSIQYDFFFGGLYDGSVRVDF